MRMDLEKLYLYLPVGFKNGQPIGYENKSVWAILQDQDIFELLHLRMWIEKQFMDFCGWNSLDVNKETVGRAFQLMFQLGIKPTECLYTGE